MLNNNPTNDIPINTPHTLTEIIRGIHKKGESITKLLIKKLVFCHLTLRLSIKVTLTTKIPYTINKYNIIKTKFMINYTNMIYD